MPVSLLEIIMKQLNIEYHFLPEQNALELDYTPCEKYEEDKRKRESYCGNRLDQWGITSNCVLASNGTVPVWTTNAVINDPKLVIYSESIPITIKTTKKPSIFARWVYRIIGAKWEKA